MLSCSLLCLLKNVGQMKHPYCTWEVISRCFSQHRCQAKYYINMTQRGF